jgi:Leucine-rich repeat (LRR) protein/plastocyanin
MTTTTTTSNNKNEDVQDDDDDSRKKDDTTGLMTEEGTRTDLLVEDRAELILPDDDAKRREREAISFLPPALAAKREKVMLQKKLKKEQENNNRNNSGSAAAASPLMTSNSPVPRLREAWEARTAAPTSVGEQNTEDQALSFPAARGLMTRTLEEFESKQRSLPSTRDVTLPYLHRLAFRGLRESSETNRATASTETTTTTTRRGVDLPSFRGLRRTAEELAEKERRRRQRRRTLIGALPRTSAPIVKGSLRRQRQQEQQQQPLQTETEHQAEAESVEEEQPSSSTADNLGGQSAEQSSAEAEVQAEEALTEEQPVPTLLLEDSGRGSSTGTASEAERVDASSGEEGLESTTTSPAEIIEADLAVAHLVSEDSALQLMEEAQEVDEQELEEQAQRRQKYQRKYRRRMLACLAASLLAIVVLTVVLGLVFSGRRSQEDLVIIERPPAPSHNQTTPSPTTEAPTAAPTHILKAFIETLPNYTKKSLRNPLSPQSEALEWLSKHQDIVNMSDWRKEQLFALATFYYAFEGPNWPTHKSNDWLVYTRPECDWWSDEAYFIGGYMAGYEHYDVHVCNPSGEFTTLSLDHLQVSKNSPSIPPELAILSSLEYIYLRQNDINASFSHVVPVATLRVMSQLSNLRGLSLYSNSLRGTLPSELGMLTSLESLYLSSNSLRGTLPSELGMLTSLESLYLSSNSFTGHIPSEVGLLTNLWYLDCSHNSFTGHIPSEFGSLTNLFELDLPSNSFTGHIPNELGYSNNLVYLNLSNNSFTGPIPSKLGFFTDLKELDLSNNSFTGHIPIEFGSLTNLFELDLSSNSFTGHIPNKLGYSNNLAHLNLSNNSFTGPIPSELGSWRNLWSLQLSHNSFTGHIPSELGLLTVLRRLYLSNNPALTGTIPCMIKNLVSKTGALAFFHVDNTSLTGTVPEELCFLQSSSCVYEYYSATASKLLSQNCSLTFDCSDELCGCDWCPCSLSHFPLSLQSCSVQSSEYWDLLDYGCDIDSTGCIKSHSSAGTGIGYEIKILCRFRAKQSGNLTVVFFDTLGGSYDHFTVGGKDYSGTTGPEGVLVEAGDLVTWDDAYPYHTDAGFIVCMAGSNMTDAFGPLVKSSTYWDLFAANNSECDIDPEDCIKSHSSAGAGIDYRNHGYCRFRAKQPGNLTVVLFDTDIRYGGDHLSVGGKDYSGTIGPDGILVEAGDLVTWDSDNSHTDAGFIVCMAGSNMTDAFGPLVKSSTYWDLFAATDTECDIDPEGCIKSHSSAGASTYEKNMYCRFRAKQSGNLTVALFDTRDSGYLTVDGTDYSYRIGPEDISVVAGDIVTWNSKGYDIHGSGFIVCMAGSNKGPLFPPVKSSEYWDLFALNNTECDIAPSGCIKSHPSAGPIFYRSNVHCRFRAKQSGNLTVVLFDIDTSYSYGGDHLTVGDKDYSGRSGPEGITVQAGDMVTWESGRYGISNGFIVCMAGSNMTAAFGPLVKSSTYWDLFAANSSECDIDPEGCIKSHAFAGAGTDYENDMYCHFRAKQSGNLSVVFFNTFNWHYYLMVGGMPYSGTSGPEGISVEAGDVLTWRSSDYHSGYDGFIVCMAGSNMTGAFPPPSKSSEYWDLFGANDTDCDIDQSGCIKSHSSAGAGTDYGNGMNCLFRAKQSGNLIVALFDINWDDDLTVGGKDYSGTTGPDHIYVEAGDVLTWRSGPSDRGNGDGFIVCLESSRSKTAATAAPNS